MIVPTEAPRALQLTPHQDCQCRLRCTSGLQALVRIHVRVLGPTAQGLVDALGPVSRHEEARAGWPLAILDNHFEHGHLHDVKTRLTEFEFTAGHELSTIPSFSPSPPLQELPSMFDDLMPHVPLRAAVPGMAPLPLSGHPGGR